MVLAEGDGHDRADGKSWAGPEGLANRYTNVPPNLYQVLRYTVLLITFNERGGSQAVLPPNSAAHLGREGESGEQRALDTPNPLSAAEETVMAQSVAGVRDLSERVRFAGRRLASSLGAWE